jgi:hypothetical protein
VITKKLLLFSILGSVALSSPLAYSGGQPQFQVPGPAAPVAPRAAPAAPAAPATAPSSAPAAPAPPAAQPATHALDPSLIERGVPVLKEVQVIPTNGDIAKKPNARCDLETGGIMEVLGESQDHTKIAVRYHAKSSSKSSNGLPTCDDGTLAFIDSSAFDEQRSLLTTFIAQCHQTYAVTLAQRAIAPQAANLNNQMQDILNHLGQQGNVVQPTAQKGLSPDDCDTLEPDLSRRSGSGSQSISLRTEKGILMNGSYEPLPPGKVAPLAIPEMNN